MANRSWLSVIFFLLLIPMLFHADLVTDGARYGLLLWYNSVVPALFPFMVISGLIISNGGVPLIMAPFYRILSPFLPISENGCYVLISGLLCGYPMGAKTCAEFVSDGRISLNEGQFLMAICNHPSPMFLLGYVYLFFSKKFHVWELLFCVYGPIFVLVKLAELIYFGKHSANHANMGADIRFKHKSSKTALDNAIRTASTDETILSSISILCKIGGYLVLFSIIIVFLRNTSPLPQFINLTLIGALEMTTGVRELSASMPLKPAWISSMAAVTFGGCSGIFQTKSVLNTKKAGRLSIRPYIFWKLLHAALSATIAAFLCNI